MSSKPISIEIADTPMARQFGLQFVKELPSMTGMLFKFQKPNVLNFWMQNTYIPLDIAFLDDAGIVVKTEQMVPLSLKSVVSDTPCVMALEVPAGTLSNIGVGKGSKITVDWENKQVIFDD